MILRKILFLVLVIALSFVPVLQAAHALTHVGDTDLTSISYADGDEEESGLDHDGGIEGDRICLDCLALTGFSIIVAVLAVSLFDQLGTLSPPCLTSRLIFLSFASPYLTRGPPRA